MTTMTEEEYKCEFDEERSAHCSNSSSSFSSSSTFSKFEEIEDEIAAYLDSPEEQGKFQLICEWEGCDEGFQMKQNASYLFHVQGHVHTMAEEMFSGNIDKYVCRWRGCVKPDGNILTELEFARHLLYHPFQQKLKVRGLIALRLSKIYVPCQLDSTYRNLVPDFPSDILCQWESCSFKCNCITSFDDHIKLHVHDQGFPLQSGPRKGITYYTCKWAECPGFTVTDKSKLQEHTQKHTNLRQYACSNCGALFCNKFKFLDHHRRQATAASGFILDNIVYQCSYCSKKYPTEAILRNHMRSHIYNYLCQYCQNTFSTSAGLRKHIIYRHRAERKFACQHDECDYRAKDRYDLAKHVERAHQERHEFACAEKDCKYTCFNEDTFNLHLKMKHSADPKNYMCHVCNKKFAEGRTLSRHLVRIHDYRRPSGVGKFKYSRQPDGFYRLQKIKYESKKLVAIKELQKQAETSLLALGVSPNSNMDLVITTDTGEEQQLKFVSYKNALRELCNDINSEDEDEENNFAGEQSTSALQLDTTLTSEAESVNVIDDTCTIYRH